MMGIVSLLRYQPLTVVADGDDACEFAGQRIKPLVAFKKSIQAKDTFSF